MKLYNIKNNIRKILDLNMHNVIMHNYIVLFKIKHKIILYNNYIFKFLCIMKLSIITFVGFLTSLCFFSSFILSQCNNNFVEKLDYFENFRIPEIVRDKGVNIKELKLYKDYFKINNSELILKQKDKNYIGVLLNSNKIYKYNCGDCLFIKDPLLEVKKRVLESSDLIPTKMDSIYLKDWSFNLLFKNLISYNCLREEDIILYDNKKIFTNNKIVDKNKKILYINKLNAHSISYLELLENSFSRLIFKSLGLLFSLNFELAEDIFINSCEDILNKFNIPNAHSVKPIKRKKENRTIKKVNILESYFKLEDSHKKLLSVSKFQPSNITLEEVRKDLLEIQSSLFSFPKIKKSIPNNIKINKYFVKSFCTQIPARVLSGYKFPLIEKEKYIKAQSNNKYTKCKQNAIMDNSIIHIDSCFCSISFSNGKHIFIVLKEYINAQKIYQILLCLIKKFTYIHNKPVLNNIFCENFIKVKSNKIEKYLPDFYCNFLPSILKEKVDIKNQNIKDSLYDFKYENSDLEYSKVLENSFNKLGEDKIGFKSLEEYTRKEKSDNEIENKLISTYFVRDNILKNYVENLKRYEIDLYKNQKNKMHKFILNEYKILNASKLDIEEMFLYPDLSFENLCTDESFQKHLAIKYGIIDLEKYIKYICDLSLAYYKHNVNCWFKDTKFNNSNYNLALENKFENELENINFINFEKDLNINLRKKNIYCLYKFLLKDEELEKEEENNSSEKVENNLEKDKIKLKENNSSEKVRKYFNESKFNKYLKFWNYKMYKNLSLFSKNVKSCKKYISELDNVVSEEKYLRIFSNKVENVVDKYKEIEFYDSNKSDWQNFITEINKDNNLHEEMSILSDLWGKSLKLNGDTKDKNGGSNTEEENLDCANSVFRNACGRDLDFFEILEFFSDSSYNISLRNINNLPPKFVFKNLPCLDLKETERLHKNKILNYNKNGIMHNHIVHDLSFYNFSKRVNCIDKRNKIKYNLYSSEINKDFFGKMYHPIFLNSEKEALSNSNRRFEFSRNALNLNFKRHRVYYEYKEIDFGLRFNLSDSRVQKREFLKEKDSEKDSSKFFEIDSMFNKASSLKILDSFNLFEKIFVYPKVRPSCYTLIKKEEGFEVKANMKIFDRTFFSNLKEMNTYYNSVTKNFNLKCRDLNFTLEGVKDCNHQLSIPKLSKKGWQEIVDYQVLNNLSLDLNEVTDKSKIFLEENLVKPLSISYPFIYHRDFGSYGWSEIKFMNKNYEWLNHVKFITKEEDFYVSNVEDNLLVSSHFFNSIEETEDLNIFNRYHLFLKFIKDSKTNISSFIKYLFLKDLNIYDFGSKKHKLDYKRFKNFWYNLFFNFNEFMNEDYINNFVNRYFFSVDSVDEFNFEYDTCFSFYEPCNLKTFIKFGLSFYIVYWYMYSIFIKVYFRNFYKYLEFYNYLPKEIFKIDFPFLSFIKFVLDILLIKKSDFTVFSRLENSIFYKIKTTINKLFLFDIMSIFKIYKSDERNIPKYSLRDLNLSDKVYYECIQLVNSFRSLKLANSKFNIFKFIYSDHDNKKIKGILLSSSPRGNKSNSVVLNDFGYDKLNIVKALAYESGLPLIVQSFRSFQNILKENRLSSGIVFFEKLMKKAEKQSPCILYLDEIDIIGKCRTGLIKSDTFENRKKQKNYNFHYTRRFSFYPLYYHSEAENGNRIYNYIYLQILKYQRDIEFKEDFLRLKFKERKTFRNAQFQNSKKLFNFNNNNHNPFTYKQSDFAYTPFYINTSRSKTVPKLFKDRLKFLEDSIYADYKTGHKALVYTTQRIEKVRRVEMMLYLLTVLDGLEVKKNIVLISSCKDLNKLDPALLRSNRFDTVIKLNALNKNQSIKLVNKKVNLFLNAVIDNNICKKEDDIKCINVIMHLENKYLNYISKRMELLGFKDIETVIENSIIKYITVLSKNKSAMFNSENSVKDLNAIMIKYLERSLLYINGLLECSPIKLPYKTFSRMHNSMHNRFLNNTCTLNLSQMRCHNKNEYYNLLKDYSKSYYQAGKMVFELTVNDNSELLYLNNGSATYDNYSVFLNMEDNIINRENLLNKLMRLNIGKAAQRIGMENYNGNLFESNFGFIDRIENYITCKLIESKFYFYNWNNFKGFNNINNNINSLEKRYLNKFINIGDRFYFACDSSNFLVINPVNNLHNLPLTWFNKLNFYFLKSLNRDLTKTNWYTFFECQTDRLHVESKSFSTSFLNYSSKNNLVNNNLIIEKNMHNVIMHNYIYNSINKMELDIFGNLYYKLNKYSYDESYKICTRNKELLEKLADYIFNYGSINKIEAVEVMNSI